MATKELSFRNFRPSYPSPALADHSTRPQLVIAMLIELWAGLYNSNPTADLDLILTVHWYSVLTKDHLDTGGLWLALPLT